MIHVREINAVAEKNKLKDTQIEKDYILSWILFGISNNGLLSKDLLFKGSTVLKKVYFPEYRFSEDLDFTLLNENIVKIDIIRGETMEYLLAQRTVLTQYTDLPKQSFHLQCYSLAEVLIEKMTALMGRTEPRDLFDFWYLTKYEGMDTRYHKPEFERKAKNKTITRTFSRKKLWQRKRT